jgi:hypothetical protein
MSELPIITGNFHGKNPVTVVKKMAGTPVLPSTDCPDVAALLYSNRGNRCFNIARPLALEFGLQCMIRQPTADTHVI